VPVPRLLGGVLVVLVLDDPGLGGGQQVVGCDEFVDEALLLRLLGLVALTLQEHLEQCGLDAEHADRAYDAAATGQQTERHLGEPDLVAALRRDAVMTGERDLEATTESS